MLDRLLETGPRQKKSAWGGMTSVIVHGVIIALVVYSTAEAGSRPTVIARPPVIPVYQSPPTEHTIARHGGTGGAVGPTATDVTRLPNPAAPIDVDIAAPDLTTTTVGGNDSLIAEIGAGGGSRGGALLGGTAGATNEATLDVPVRVLSERTPAYPEMLRAAGIIGSVRVQFVVDTTGRAEPSSIRVLDSTHELFTRTVLTAIRQSRFTAGEVAGQRVRTLVERSYRFDIGNAR